GGRSVFGALDRHAQVVETVVQWVRTSWAKRSRGGAEAARRNAVPVAFLLPAFEPPFVHEIAMDEPTASGPGSQCATDCPTHTPTCC
ncbi:hypothetical protein, partial [Actinomadura sp. HBU206391]|uniref:hypothetical protein n=1 Tax=Actinomadura sp. HBU206391 TaxID=2731692 RepID=UPI001C9CD60F